MLDTFKHRTDDVKQTQVGQRMRRVPSWDDATAGMGLPDKLITTTLYT